ncbi:MAG: hypothetical protein R2734_05420 [Nocardioides sp.]
MISDPFVLSRALLTWALGTGILAGLTWLAGPVLAAADGALTRAAGFPELLLLVAAGVTVSIGGWLWLLTTLVLLGVGRGRLPGLVGAWPRPVVRLVLTACGVAAASGLAGPAYPADGPHLAHPTRSCVGATARPRGRLPTSPAYPRPGGRGASRGLPVVARRGRAGRGGASTGDAAVAQRWREIYAANRRRRAGPRSPPARHPAAAARRGTTEPD